MTVQSLATAAACAVLVPLVSTVTPLIDLPGTVALPAFVAASAAPSQAPANLPVKSARVEPRSASAGLNATIDAVIRADDGPAWLAWSVVKVPSRDGRRGQWGDNGFNRCVLDDDGELNGSPGISDDTRRLVVLARIESREVARVTFADERCTVDAGRRTVYWLSDVAAAQSVEWLAARVRDWAAQADVKGDDEHSRVRAGKGALPALALHADPSAGRALESFVAAGQPRKLRKDAAFWLGAARAEQGLPVITRLVREDADDSFREHLTFVLTLPGDAGVDTLLDVARRDASPKVRGQALFWLGQKAGKRAVAALDSAASDDPDSDVRKKAVFAISQLPKDEGVPKLIALARTHRDREVRKQAMFWLGQSGDERALAFFAEVLK
jgi:HEAT repeat protein